MDAGPRPWRQQFRGSGFPYYRVEFEFHSNYHTWDLKLRDRGSYYLSAGSPRKRQPFRHDDPPIPTGQPGDLDGDGGMRYPAQPVVYNTVRRKKERNFALLGVPLGP